MAHVGTMPWTNITWSTLTWLNITRTSTFLPLDTSSFLLFLLSLQIFKSLCLFVYCFGVVSTPPGNLRGLFTRVGDLVGSERTPVAASRVNLGGFCKLKK